MKFPKLTIKPYPPYKPSPPNKQMEYQTQVHSEDVKDWLPKFIVKKYQ
jgi:hypothetical protein